MKLRRLDARYLPVAGTLVTLVVLLAVGQARYSTQRQDFISMKLVSNLLIDNSFLLVLAVGMTFVILAGGIDLSVGAVVALVGLTVAQLFIAGWPAPVVVVLGILVGTVCGSIIGVLVQHFDVQPFIASLAVLFLARGAATVIGTRSLPIDDPTFSALASWSIRFGEGRTSWRINASILIALGVLAVAYLVLHHTRFGRTVYGLGAADRGNAVNLMGLRADRTRVWVYVISGTCAGVAGILFALYTKSGYNLTGVGMELDAIAAVVIGGTLLTGGYGYVLGTGAGVLVYGLIQVLNSREGLESWWTRVAIGAVLLAFVVLQRLIAVRRRPAVAAATP
ncbi:sugar ABC transporter permease YjfF [Streptomyces sp. NP160]|uniref:ABC transporter permease subunit n=1 Tax=Streptomyces sp. NP160 TaxID=2586637 RepID=UPI001119E08A|nr:sugar ABC transporter permease YjfF [Streptomyces sp. NP160]TNM67922.1 sugar ABC transporter permease YjfF [Streptomyces sp. NP160]